MKNKEGEILEQILFFFYLNVFDRSMRMVFISSQLAQLALVMEDWKPPKFSPQEQFGSVRNIFINSFCICVCDVWAYLSVNNC